MRLATRTGLAAFAASFLSLAAIGAVFQGVSSRILADRVDAQLEVRAETAPILAAIGERLSRSELSGTVGGARIRADGGSLVEVGLLPQEALPPLAGPGWSTAQADGERWRLYAITVRDVPEVGDEALVQLVAPLGDTEAAAQRIRRRAVLVGLIAALGAGLVGYLLGSLASRPLTALRRATAGLDDGAPERWRVGTAYGSAEVDEVAATLNHSLSRLAEETERRGAALESARSFASAATHELRAPLQTAMTNLNLAAADQLPADERRTVLARATAAVGQTAASLAAVRSLAEAEFAEPSWFAPTDLSDVVEAAVAGETRRSEVSLEVVSLEGAATEGATAEVMPVAGATAEGATAKVIPVAGAAGGAVAKVMPVAGATEGAAAADPGTGPPRDGPTGGALSLWAAGVQLAVANVVRNAVVHGRPTGPERARLVVTVAGPTVTVDDNGPGIAPEDRHRLVERFERGSRADGSGLGLAIARQVALAHGGSLAIDDSPLGGARVTLTFAPPSP